MTSEPAPSITDVDVRSLAAKLKGLHALLTPPEQTLLHTVLRRAAGSEASGEADTEGYAWVVSFNPFTYLDAIRPDEGTGHEGRGRRGNRPRPKRRTAMSDRTRRRS